MARRSDLLDVDDLGCWLKGFADEVARNSAWLNALDSAIGDADHGTILESGTAAVRRRLDSGQPESPRELISICGRTIRETAGGAGGALYASFFLGMAAGMRKWAAVDVTALAGMLESGLDSVIDRGHAAPGDKTFVDVLAPVTRAVQGSASNGASLATALRACHRAAMSGRDATTPMLARKGRASYLGERSAGHLDPGAASAELLFRALAQLRPSYAPLSTVSAT